MPSRSVAIAAASDQPAAGVPILEPRDIWRAPPSYARTARKLSRPGGSEGDARRPSSATQRAQTPRWGVCTWDNDR